MAVDAGRIGLFGGTFNPVHFGHLRLAEDVREEFSLQTILFIPTHTPPHKEMTVEASPEDRLRMVECAIEGNSHFRCDDIEIRRGGASYTVDTVDYIYGKYRFEGQPRFIIGSDLFSDLHTWRRIDELASRVRFIVMLRDNYPIVSPAGDDIIDLKYDCFGRRKMEITSSEIRERLRMGRSVCYLMPESVLTYIAGRGLYGAESGH